MPQSRPTEPPPGALMLTYWEAAWLLRCGYCLVRQMCQTGELDARKSGYRSVKVTRRSVEKFIAEGSPFRRYTYHPAQKPQRQKKTD